MTKVYVLIDIVNSVYQIMGSAMTASGEHDAKTGINIIMGGLGIQLAAFASFVLMAAVFYRRLSREPTATALRPHVQRRRHVRMLYAVSALIFVWSGFWLIEFGGGMEGTLTRTESLIYVFDAATMFLVAAVL